LNLINTIVIDDYITLGILDLEAFAQSSGLNVKREIEKKGTLYLLQNLLKGKVFNLCYTEQNKPYLKDSDTHLSISHSHSRLAIILNTRQSTGVDIELLRDKIQNVKHKYLSAQELSFAGNDAVLLTVLWAAKEAIYKAYGLKEIDFASHMFIEPFGPKDDLFFGHLKKNDIAKKYLLKREQHENYILVYILNEVQ